jgi:hypothetical protein
MLVTGHSGQPLEWIAKNADGWITYPRGLQRQAEVAAHWRAAAPIGVAAVLEQEVALVHRFDAFGRTIRYPTSSRAPVRSAACGPRPKMAQVASDRVSAMSRRSISQKPNWPVDSPMVGASSERWSGGMASTY